MSWYKNSTILSWITIAITIFLAVITLFFTSDRFATKTRIYYRRVIFYIRNHENAIIYILFVLSTIILIVLRQYSYITFAYAIAITIIACQQYKRKQNIASVVSCRLGNLSDEGGGRGLQLKNWEDGISVLEQVGSSFVRRTDVDQRSNYIYFSFREDVVNNFRDREIYVIVEYLDHANYGEFNIHYDSSDDKYPNKIFKPGKKSMLFTGSKRWQVATWKITDGNFRKLQQDVSDFRFHFGRVLSSQYIEGRQERFNIYLRRVTVIALE